MTTFTSACYGTPSATASLALMQIERRELTPSDVWIDILYCGVCHSDLHTARNEWGGTQYPCVPGHEIVGKVARIGSKVSKFQVGDTVGVGCLVDSCGSCPSCQSHEEQFCLKGSVQTYNSYDSHLNSHTFGGYSKFIAVDESFVLSIKHKDNLAAVAPLLCAGITTYSPLKRWGAGPGKTVGIVGFGGLGHMGLKLAKALEARVVQFTTSSAKKEDAIRLGADEVIISTETSSIKSLSASFDLILDTVAADHDINSYLRLLKPHGTLILVGAPPSPLQVAAFSVIGGAKNLAGSLIGGIAETQQVLDFCASKQIVSEIELIPISKINEAYERMLKSDVKYRFVIDMQSL